MSIEQALPQVLEHVDLTRWERPARLLRLIAVLQEGPNPVPLGRQLLVAAGRTPRQAAYDHEVLIRLADRDRVLLRWRGEGRRPDSWAIAPLDKWRHVPWITRRRDVLTAFSTNRPDEAVVLWTKRAAQVLSVGSDTPLLAALEASGLSVNLKSTTPRHMSITPRAERDREARSVHNATANFAASPSYLESEFTPSLPPSEAAEGVSEWGGKQDAPTNPGQELLTAVRSVVQSPISGTNADRIRRVGRSNPGLLDRLVRFAGTLGGLKTGIEAARQIEIEADRLAQGVVVSAARAREQQAIDACHRCDRNGWLLLPDLTAMRCDHAPEDDLDGVGFGL